ncbi:MAG: hypothetical protein GOV15_00390, partial [Candidatus Diapherotrites archaeon]|nr:hypothetical protein [Candidatus Diapherotrites archaeon]
MRWKRTDFNGSLRLKDEGRDVVLMGWVQRVRKHGKLFFVDLRDHSGVTQIVFNPKDLDKELYTSASSVKSEWVLAVKGSVVKRLQVNKEMPTGDVEIVAGDLEILSESVALPFEVMSSTQISVGDELRLKHRYLDLRKPEMQKILRARSKTSKAVRDFLHDNGFIEVETPILTKSTPEGARDYIVPSRVHPGTFYALPQSPQLFKQLLMVGGFDKYF